MNKIIITFLLLIILTTLYIDNKNYIENFVPNTLFDASDLSENILDCSKCKIPINNNCVKIYDISYTKQFINNKAYDLSYNYIDTNKIFCPWEEQCSSNTLFKNSEQRANTKFKCCDDSPFYTNYTNSYSKLNNNLNTKTRCDNLQNFITELSNNNYTNYTRIIDDNSFIKIKAICNQPDFSGVLLDLSSTREISLNILRNEDLSIEDILSYQSILYTNSAKDTITEISLNLLNEELLTLNPAVSRDRARKIEIQNEILDSNYFRSEGNIYKIIKFYNALDNNEDLISNEFLINSNQFFNCFGEVKNPNNIPLGQDICMNDLKQQYNRDNFFDVVPDASYSTMQDNKQVPYPNYNDFEMELLNLNSANKFNIDVANKNNNKNIVNSYLNYINSFYNNLVSNINFSGDSPANQNLKMINNELIISHPLNNYSHGTINNLECTDSIIGNKDFSYCGPSPYNA